MIEMHELMHEYYQYALLKTVEGEEALNYLTKRFLLKSLLNHVVLVMLLIILTFVMTFTTKRL